jgi:hypothetical protein
MKRLPVPVSNAVNTESAVYVANAGTPASRPTSRMLSDAHLAGLLLRSSAAVLIVLFSLLDSACQSEYGTILDPLGPVPFYTRVSSSAVPSLPAGKGRLVVGTPTGLVYVGSQMYYPHLGYFIESENGWPAFCVANHLRRTDEIPTDVQLPAGLYTLIAEADGLGKVRVQIRITSGALTKVTLQRLRGENDVW